MIPSFSQTTTAPSTPASTPLYSFPLPTRPHLRHANRHYGTLRECFCGPHTKFQVVPQVVPPDLSFPQHLGTQSASSSLFKPVLPGDHVELDSASGPRASSRIVATTRFVDQVIRFTLSWSRPRSSCPLNPRRPDLLRLAVPQERGYVKSSGIVNVIKPSGFSSSNNVVKINHGLSLLSESPPPWFSPPVIFRGCEVGVFCRLCRPMPTW